MKTIIWKFPDHDLNHPISEFLATFYQFHPRFHINYSDEWFRGNVKIEPLKYTVIFNDGGIRNRAIPTSIKNKFKRYMTEYSNYLPQIPMPFTGKMELNFGDNSLGEVRFIPEH